MEISQELVRDIFSYLQTRPWGEVNKLMVGLMMTAKNSATTVEETSGTDESTEEATT